jgi:hypothetical protein
LRVEEFPPQALEAFLMSYEGLQVEFEDNFTHKKLNFESPIYSESQIYQGIVVNGRRYPFFFVRSYRTGKTVLVAKDPKTGQFQDSLNWHGQYISQLKEVREFFKEPYYKVISWYGLVELYPESGSVE